MPDELTTLSGHTEGPWRKCGGYSANYVAVVAGDSYIVDKMADHVVSREHGNPIKAPSYDEQQANARLIAAAPDLLAIATELHKLVSGGVMLVEHAEAIWTSRGLTPPQATEEARK